MFEKKQLYYGILAVMLSQGSAWPHQVGSPSQATMRSPPTVSVNSQAVDLTLTEAVFLGLRGNPSIRSAYLERIAQKYDLRVAEDYFSPKLVLAGRYAAARNQDDRYRQGQFTPVTTKIGEIGTRFSLSWANQIQNADRAGQFRNDGVTFSVIQPLLRGGGREVATAPVRMARLMEQNNRLALQATVSQTVTRIVLSYRELLRAQEQVRISQDALARSRQLLNINKTLIQAGRMAEFEIVQTEADVATQELGVEDANNLLAARKLELLQLLGLDLNGQVRATELLRAEKLQLRELDAQRVAFERQPAYLMQLIASEQAEINLLVARNESLWDVSLIGRATQTRDRYSGGAYLQGSDRRWEGYAGIQLEIPIGDLSTRQNEVRATVAMQDQAVQLKNAQQVLEREVNDAVRDVDSRWRQYQIAERAYELSRRKLDIEREKLQVGRSSNFQVLSFESDLRNAESARLSALVGYLNAQTQLDQRLGTTLESWDIALND
ncbi:TolC family protein [Achromobacter xylosoxidans]